MSRSRSNKMLKKSVSAMLTAIETYNKPDHKYREETFSILALNAWELLFKSKILAAKGNNLRELFIYEQRILKNGSKSKRQYIRKNRAGNPMTISIGKAMGKIETDGLGTIAQAIRANLDALAEIRDNAVHLTNISAHFSRAVQEIGTATIQNYVQLTKEWFDYDLSQYNFYLMPLAFVRDFHKAAVVNLSAEESNIAKYFTELYRVYDSDSAGKYAVTLELDIKLRRSALPTAVRLAWGDNPDAVPITIAEKDIRNWYPWDYRQLTEKLAERYPYFKVNNKFHNIRMPLIKDKRYVMSRYLDPNNPNSSKKDFYSPNIINEFDKHYTRL
jgi:hypothetical protein